MVVAVAVLVEESTSISLEEELTLTYDHKVKLDKVSVISSQGLPDYYTIIYTNKLCCLYTVQRPCRSSITA